MQKFFSTCVFSAIILISCVNNKHIESLQSNKDIKIEAALKAYVTYQDALGKYDRRSSDTLKLYNSVYESGCYVYGMVNMAFYYGFIDTTSFPKLKMEKERLPYYRSYQNSLNDTFKIQDFEVETPRRKFYLSFSEKYKSPLHLTPLNLINDSISIFGIYTLGYDTGTTDLVTLKVKNNKFSCDTIIRYWHDHSFMPCQLAPDTLREIDFDVLFEQYGLKSK